METAIKTAEFNIPERVLTEARRMLAELHGNEQLCGNSAVVDGYWIETHTLGCRNAADEPEDQWEESHRHIRDEYVNDGVSVVLDDENSSNFASITPQINKLAANYLDMFQGFLKVISKRWAHMPREVEQYKNLINGEVSWAKSHLKKNDRIIWYLRWIRLMLLKDTFGHNTETDQATRDKYYTPELHRMSQMVGRDVMEYRVLRNSFNSEVLRLHDNLDHFLSLPIPDLTNTVFDKQAPDDLFSTFKQYENVWQGRTKGMLVPQEEDQIIVQFADGWAWWKLSRAYCSEEARAMGHCGNVNGQTRTSERILSLRRPTKLGRETRWEPFLTFILDKDGFLGEMKGRANQKPAERYHPYIVGLLERTDIVKGVKGGGYLPSHNFRFDDLEWKTQQKLEKENPGLQSCRRRLRELDGKPDQALITRISKCDRVQGQYIASVGGWVRNKWNTPGDFIESEIYEISSGGVRGAYFMFIGETPKYEPGSYQATRNTERMIKRLPASDIVLIQKWLEGQGAWMGQELDIEADQPDREYLLRTLIGTPYASQKQAVEAARMKLWDVWKAGITPAMRQDIGDQLKQALQEAWNRGVGTGLEFGDNFWEDEVKEVMPLQAAAALADGGDEEEDEQYDDQEEEEFQIEYHYGDPYEIAYGQNLNQLAKITKGLDRKTRKEVEEAEHRFQTGDRGDFVQWANTVLPGAFTGAADKAWSLEAAHRAAYAEFAQQMLPFQNGQAQHASALMQKDAKFEIVAANYEDMFKNVLALATEEEVQDVDNEISWAKKALKKQDRITWWLRWFRLGILSDLLSKAKTEEVHAEVQLHQLQRQKEHWQGQHDHYVNKNIPIPKEWRDLPQNLVTELEQLQQAHAKQLQKQQAIKKAYDTELRSLSSRTGQSVHSGVNFVLRSHQTVEHFLSLPVPAIQNVVWDKQTPGDLLDVFYTAEGQWQERTKGLLQPQTEPDPGRYGLADVTNLKYDLEEILEPRLQQLQSAPAEAHYIKTDTDGNVVAVSISPKPGYTPMSPEEAERQRQERIAELEKDIAERREKINSLVGEVDTIFVQFQDGWAWWKLSRAYCSEEAKAMGHCGNVTGQSQTDQRILSLRQPKKVGNETYWEPHLTFIWEPNGFLGEMKGKGNQKPAPQYHKYIITLLEDPRIKGIKGGGYLPSHNFKFTDLTKEQQEAVIQKNPNLNSFSRQLAKAGATQQIMENIAIALWPDDPMPSFDRNLQGWVTERWPSVDDLVQEKGNDTAKWLARQMGGDSEYFDYAEGASIGDAFTNMSTEQENVLRRFIEIEHAEEVKQWREQQIEDGAEDPEFANADLADFIQEYNLDEIESGLMRALETGMRHGAEEEMYNALTSAIKDFSIEGTGEIVKLPLYTHKVKTRRGEEERTGITWDSPVAAYLPIQAGAELADKGEPFSYYEDENVRGEAEITCSEPHYGWSGWSQEGFDDDFNEEFGRPTTPADKRKEQKELEREAKKRPDLIAVRENWNGGPITGWRQNTQYKGPKLGPGGVKVDDQGNPIKKKAPKKPRKKAPGAKTKTKRRAAQITAAGEDWKTDPHYFAKKKNELLEKLKALPYAADIKVFGSLARGKENAADIDLVLDLRGTGKHSAWRDLLALAHEYYGSLDPFILADAGIIDGKPTFNLWVRNDQATGWIHSRNKAKMLKNMEKEGVPLVSIQPFKTASTMKQARGDKPVIETHGDAEVMWIDWMWVPENLRGKGMGRSIFEAWEARLPKTVKLLRLFAADSGDGPAAGFWEKMGFSYVYDTEHGDESDQYMWKGVNGNPTPPPVKDDPEADDCDADRNCYDIEDEPEQRKRGSQQKWYHGTALANLEKILKDGWLRPGMASKYTEEDIPRHDAVYVTRHPTIAMDYGYSHGKGKGVTLEVEVDPKNLLADEDSIHAACKNNSLGRPDDQPIVERIRQEFLKSWNAEMETSNAMGAEIPLAQTFEAAWQQFEDAMEEAPAEVGEWMKAIAEHIRTHEPELNHQIIELTGHAAHIGPARVVGTAKTAAGGLQPVAIDDLPKETQNDIASLLAESAINIDADDLFGLVDPPRVLIGNLPTEEVYRTCKRKSSLVAVRKYMKMLENKNFDFDPILVFDGKFLDGGHRMEAYHRMKRPAIPVVDIANLVNAPAEVWQKWKDGDKTLSADQAFPVKQADEQGKGDGDPDTMVRVPKTAATDKGFKAGRYLAGGCVTFALALSRAFGYKIRILWDDRNKDVMHAIAVDAKGVAYDAKGRVNEQEIESHFKNAEPDSINYEFKDNPMTWRNATETTIKKVFSSEPHMTPESGEVERLVKYLKKHPTDWWQKRAAVQPTGPVYFYIEVPKSSRDHFWDEPPEGNLEFWAFKDRPRCFYDQKIIFKFDGQPVAEAKVLKIEEPGLSKCEHSGKYEKHYKVFWNPADFKKYKTAAGLKAEPLPDEITDDGFITPSGMWIDCAYVDHNVAARRLGFRGKEPRREAVEAGYVRVVWWPHTNTGFLFFRNAVEAQQKAYALMQHFPSSMQSIGIEAGHGNFEELETEEAWEKFGSKTAANPLTSLIKKWDRPEKKLDALRNTVYDREGHTKHNVIAYGSHAVEIFAAFKKDVAPLVATQQMFPSMEMTFAQSDFEKLRASLYTIRRDVNALKHSREDVWEVQDKIVREIDNAIAAKGSILYSLQVMSKTSAKTVQPSAAKHRTFYHVTPKENVDSIASEGLKPVNGYVYLQSSPPPKTGVGSVQSEWRNGQAWLAVRVSSDVPLEDDPEFTAGESFRTQQSIAPEYLSLVLPNSQVKPLRKEGAKSIEEKQQEMKQRWETHRNWKRETCSKGHALTPDNIRLETYGGHTRKRCLTCDDEKKRRWYEKHKKGTVEC